MPVGVSIPDSLSPTEVQIENEAAIRAALLERCARALYWQRLARAGHSALPSYEALDPFTRLCLDADALAVLRAAGVIAP